MKKKQTIIGLKKMKEFARGFYTTYLLKDAGSKKNATVLFLYGDLGSGKTTFTRMLAQVLGVSSRVTSPTFVIEKSHRISKGSGFQKLIHIDAYRLSGDALCKALDLDDILDDPKNLICIEWPENLSKNKIEPDFEIFFEFVDEDARKIRIL